MEMVASDGASGSKRAAHWITSPEAEWAAWKCSGKKLAGQGCAPKPAAVHWAPTVSPSYQVYLMLRLCPCLVLASSEICLSKDEAVPHRGGTMSSGAKDRMCPQAWDAGTQSVGHTSLWMFCEVFLGKMNLRVHRWVKLVPFQLGQSRCVQLTQGLQEQGVAQWAFFSLIPFS